jgi:ABC-2 type transport system permease protein
MYFPAAIFTGRIKTQAQALEGLGIQLFWVVVLLALAHFLWVRGLRRYTAVGG